MKITNKLFFNFLYNSSSIFKELIIIQKLPSSIVAEIFELKDIFIIFLVLINNLFFV